MKNLKLNETELMQLMTLAEQTAENALGSSKKKHFNKLADKLWDMVEQSQAILPNGKV